MVGCSGGGCAKSLSCQPQLMGLCYVEIELSCDLVAVVGQWRALVPLFLSLSARPAPYFYMMPWPREGQWGICMDG